VIVARSWFSLGVGATALCAAAGLAGCGGGSSFTSQADSICKTYNAKINSLAKPTTNAEIVSFLDKFLPLVQQGTAKLKAVKPPSDQASQYQAYLAVLEQEVALTQQADAAARAGNITQAKTLAAQTSQLSAQDKAMAKALGLKDCA
jgi:phage I-like protein